MSRYHQCTIIFPLFLLFFTACAVLRPGGSQAGGGLVESDSFQGMIFTAEKIAANQYWPHNDDPWTPSEADILALEGQLPGFLQEEYPVLWQKLESYTRQYWGTATPSGNRAVYANFFCDDHGLISDRAWHNDLVEVIDGGDCYFQTIYDLEDGVFIRLAINGEA